MGVMKQVSLLLSCIVILSLIQGHATSVTCDLGASNCHIMSNSCLRDHPISKEVSQCEGMFKREAISGYAGLNISECCNQDDTSSPCLTASHKTRIQSQYYQLKQFSFELYSLDPWHFSVNVSWIYDDFEQALGDGLKGYELRVIEPRQSTDRILKCLCIWEPHIRRIALGNDSHLYFRSPSPSSSALKVKIITLPYDPVYHSRDRPGVDFYSMDKTVNWPSSCNDDSLEQNQGVCPIPLYDSPRNVRVTPFEMISNGTKELQVSWDHPSSSQPPPTTYYVEVSSEYENWTLTTNETQSIIIKGLDLRLNYSVRVQAYFRCSGLSSFYSSREIGCGRFSDLISEEVPLSTSSGETTMRIKEMKTTAHSLSATEMFTTDPFIATSLYIALPLVVVTIVLIISIVGLTFYFLKRPSKRQRFYLTNAPRNNNNKQNVLVLYSQDTSTKKQVMIQTYVVGRLRQEGFKVLSCNDHTEKLIIQWVEEQTRLASSVLIVCNKNFYREWNSHEGSHLMNSLEIIINSAIANRSIEKYAIVLVEKGDECYIPNNTYLESMKCFIMEKQTCDLEKIVSFLRNNQLEKV